MPTTMADPNEEKYEVLEKIGMDHSYTAVDALFVAHRYKMADPHLQDMEVSE